MAWDTKEHFGSRARGNVWRYIPLIVLLLAGALCIYKSFYGFDWSDETYYSALPYRLLTGDSLFVNSWDIHQTSALITLPLVALFRVFSSGSMTGILLFMRIIYAVCATLTGFYAYRVISKTGTRWAAAVSGTLLALFVPGGIGTLSYNSLALLFTALSWLLLWDAEEGKQPRVKTLLSGVCFTLAVQAYPYLVVMLVIYIVYYIMARMRRKNGTNRLVWLLWLAGVAGICVTFVLVVLVNSSLSNLFENVKYLLSDPEHPAKSMMASMREYAVALVRLFGAAGVGAALVTAAALGFSFVKDAAKRQAVKPVLFMLALAVVAWSLLRVWVVSPDNTSRINMLALPLVLVGPAVFFMLDRKYHPSVWLYVAGWVFSAAVQLGSNNDLNHSAYPLMLSAVAVVAYCGAFWMDIRTAGFKTAAVLGAVVLLAVLASVVFVRTDYAYRDERLPRLMARMESGPAAGIYTTADAADKYEEVVAAITEYAPMDGTAFYTKLLPFGYLCTGLMPATPSLWRTRLDSPRLAQYYELHPEIMPDFVFVVNQAYGITNGDNPMKGALAETLSGPEYSRTRLDCGIVYVRQGADSN